MTAPGALERPLHIFETVMEQIVKWRYSELPTVFRRDVKAETDVVDTSNESRKMPDALHPGMVFVEAVMHKYDAPIDLIVGGHALADSDYGVPGSHSAANSKIPLPRSAATSS